MTPDFARLPLARLPTLRLQPARLLIARLLMVCLLATSAGCALWGGGDDTEIDPDENARILYERASEALNAGNFVSAISSLENLTAVYPFSEEARQAQLDLMYAYWRNNQPDSAISAADRFMLENPTHPRVDYALYIQGLARFPPEAGPLEKLFRTDMDKRPPGQMRAAFASFQRLVQQYPDSRYVADARQRMIYLRNRLAMREVRVAEFYSDRNAHVAAINRARNVIENYQETPAVIPALRIMAQSYDALEMPELAADTRLILESNRAR